MTTWHQERGGKLSLPGAGYVMESDAPNVMRSKMTFGEDKELALRCLNAHRRNSPNLSHYLYYNGNLFA